MTPTEAYQSDIELRGFKPDQSQSDAVAHTQKLYDELMDTSNTSTNRQVKSVFNFFKEKKTPPVKGLYFWGGVGRGKSYLLDTFYDCLPFPDKSRIHFNQFMQDIHNQLKNLPKTPNPLTVVSSSIAEKCRILCIDEFHVDDITDAMIMARLLDSLFEFGVTLVTSSNIAPIDLYKNGLQRERFLPAIDLIISNTQILHLDNGLDYRVALLEKHGVFLINADTSSKNDAILEQHLVRLANNQTTRDTQIELNGRQIQCRARSDSQIWFDFCEICETPRSSIDYIALAKQFEAILISNIPIMDDGKNDVVQRFIQLVDATYDHRVKLIVSAFAAPNLLYAGKGLNFPFQRTISRLYEMRSEDYLKLPHID